MAIKFQKPSWLLMLFSLPFFGVGIGFFFISVIPTLYLGITVQNWDRVPGTVTYVNLNVSHDDSTTYQAQANYQYEVNGKTYFNDQVGFSSSNDNIGDWQQDTYQKLKREQASNEPFFVFVHPTEPEKSYLYPELRWGLLAFKMIFVITFGGIGGVMFFASFIEITKAKLEAEAKTSKSNNRFSSAAHTQSKSIYSSVRKIFWGYLVIGLLIAAISSPVLINFLEEWQSGNKLIILAMVFPLLALGFLIAALKAAFRILKFGRSPLIMKPYPASVGGHFSATVQINTAYKSNQRYKVTITCVNRYTSNSGGKSSTTETTRWHDEGIAYADRDINGRTLLRFAFNIPNKLPETTEPSASYYFWRIDIDATVAGTQFKRSFTVPVQQQSGAQTTQQYLANQHPAMATLTDDRIALLNSKSNSDEFSMDYPIFSYPLQRLASVLFGGVFIASGIGASIGGAPFIFPLIFVPVGSIFAAVSIRNLLTSARVIVNSNGIQLHSSFIGLIKKTITISPGDFENFIIAKANVWESSNNQKQYFYTIEAKGKLRTKFTVVDRIEGEETAEKLVQRFNKLIS